MTKLPNSERTGSPIPVSHGGQIACVTEDNVQAVIALLCPSSSRKAEMSRKLEEAIKSSNLDLIKELIANWVQIEPKHLKQALVKKEQDYIFNYLFVIYDSQRIEFKTKLYLELVIIAARNNKWHLVAEILRKDPAVISAKDKFDNTLFHYAAEGGELDFFYQSCKNYKLAFYQNMLSKVNKDGDLPLHVAAANSDKPCADEIISHILRYYDGNRDLQLKLNSEGKSFIDLLNEGKNWSAMIYYSYVFKAKINKQHKCSGHRQEIFELKQEARQAKSNAQHALDQNSELLKLNSVLMSFNSSFQQQNEVQRMVISQQSIEIENLKAQLQAERAKNSHAPIPTCRSAESVALCRLQV